MNFFSFNFPFFVLRPPPIRFLMVRPQCIHIGHQCNDQLTAVKTGSPLTSITRQYRGLRCWPIEVKYFLKLSADKFQVFNWSQDQVYFFLIHMKYVLFMCRTIKTDLGRENSASYYRQGRQLFLTLLTTVTRWSRSTSNFYALTGQNLTGEFMRKTLTAEADRVLYELEFKVFLRINQGSPVYGPHW